MDTIVSARNQVPERPVTNLAALKEHERPQAPPLTGVTERQRAQGRHLAVIHRHHLMDVARLLSLVARIETDRSAAPALAAVVAGLEMRRNLSMFGALCGRECMALTFHHDAEESHIFPEIARMDGFAPLIAKLRQEHEVVHALIDELGDGAEALSARPEDDAAYAALKDTVTRLEAVLRSHFRYEETELEEALGTLPYF
jgi:Hemerythrin HHE cation binding domain.